MLSKIVYIVLLFWKKKKKNKKRRKGVYIYIDIFVFIWNFFEMIYKKWGIVVDFGNGI